MAKRKLRPSDDEVVTAYVDRLISEKENEIGTKIYSGEIRMWLRKGLKTQLEIKMEQATVMAIPDETLDQMEEILDNHGDINEIDRMFEEIDPELAIMQAMEEFRREFLAEDTDADKRFITSAQEEANVAMARKPQGLGDPITGGDEQYMTEDELAEQGLQKQFAAARDYRPKIKDVKVVVTREVA